MLAVAHPNKTLEPGENYRLDCKFGDDRCIVENKDYYESKQFLNRICFPKSNDEVHYDSTIQYLAKIYDPDSGESFDKVINNEDTKVVDGRVYIAEDVINGENDSQQASARLINLSYFTQLFTLWINDLDVTKYAILGSVGFSNVLFPFPQMLRWIHYFLINIISSSWFYSISSLLLLFA